MPQTKSAKKALRVSRRRAKINSLMRKKVKAALSLARKKISLENIKRAESLIDQAAKKGLIHQRKASRLKSRLAKLFKKTRQKTQIIKKIKESKKKIKSKN